MVILVLQKNTEDIHFTRQDGHMPPKEVRHLMKGILEARPLESCLVLPRKHDFLKGLFFLRLKSKAFVQSNSGLFGRKFRDVFQMVKAQRCSKKGDAFNQR